MRQRVRTKFIPPGTVVYHGTDAATEFDTPTAPAWFAPSIALAERWAGWRAERLGKRRVIAFRTTVGRELADTVKLEDWERLGVALCDDPEPIIGDLAMKLARAGSAGWYGRQELMFTATGDLVRVSVHPID